MRPGCIPSSIASLAWHLGIPLSSRKTGSTWNGKDLSTALAGNDSDIVHDIAHWLVAPPSRRRCPDYGLGPDPNRSDVTHARLLVSPDHALREEELASALGVLLERALGMDWRDTLEMHGWELSELPLDKLRARKLIDAAARPVALRGLRARRMPGGAA